MAEQEDIQENQPSSVYDAEQAEAWRRLVKDSLLLENVRLRAENEQLCIERDHFESRQLAVMAANIRGRDFARPTTGVVIMGFVSLVASSLTLVYLTKTRPDDNKLYSLNEQRLVKAAESIKELGKFVTYQQTQMETRKQVLAELERKREQLRPVVEADAKVVDAVLTLNSERQARDKYKDVIVGFIVGVLGSALVAVAPGLYRRIRRQDEKDVPL